MAECAPRGSSPRAKGFSPTPLCPLRCCRRENRHNRRLYWVLDGWRSGVTVRGGKFPGSLCSDSRIPCSPARIFLFRSHGIPRKPLPSKAESGYAGSRCQKFPASREFTPPGRRRAAESGASRRLRRRRRCAARCPRGRARRGTPARTAGPVPAPRSACRRRQARSLCGRR
jgi:hypothetical protein